MTPGIRFAQMDDERLAKLKALEDALGVHLLALEPDEHRLAKLDDAQLEQIRELEDDLGVFLVAYQPKAQ